MNKRIPTVSVVIINWNSGPQLRECLNSVEFSDKTSYELDETVVVDNASNDASMSNIESVALPLRVYRNAENLGFAAACNQGASESKSDYLLFLNPDARLEATSIQGTVAFLEANPSSGVCGIQLVNEAGVVSRTCAKFPTLRSMLSYSTGFYRLGRGFFRRYQMDDWDHQTSQFVDHVIGAFYMVRRSVFVNLGGFDERFFVYLEDLDFSLRVQRSGHSVYFLTTERAFHKGGGTSEQVKARRLFYSLNSRIQYCQKHFSSVAAGAVVFSTLLLEPVIRIVNGCLNGSPEKVAETFKGYCLLYRHLILPKSGATPSSNRRGIGVLEVPGSLRKS